jgi:two-component system, OmpR family, sensor histidine kinase MprB
MPLRRRLTLAAAAAVAVAVALAAVAAYVAVRNELRAQVDDQLQQQFALRREPGPPLGFGGRGFGLLSARRGGPTPYMQIVGRDGQVLVFGPEQVALPVTTRVRAVADGASGPFLADAEARGTHVRVLTAPAQGGAVQFGRSLTAVDAVLRRLRLILLLVCLGGIALAAALGRLVSRNFVAPIASVTEAARHISQTEDLSRRIAVTSQDEVGELAAHFNAMLDTLEGSIAAQRQLVADASHELRTPITSLRTNIEVLLEQGDELSDDDRRRLLADVLEQSEELSTLIGDVIELARGDLPITSAEDVRLDRIATDSIARAHRAFPHVNFEPSLEPVIVEGVPERLARAVNNLLDNAAHHSPRDGLVEVVVDREGIRVRDHGTGIDEADLPYVFDRFYRGANSRHRQGSGLGLAIVRQVAVQHSGSIDAGNAPDGGAVFTLRLPTVAEETPDGDAGADALAADSLWVRP